MVFFIMRESCGRFNFDFSGDRRLDPTRDTRKLRELRSKVRVQEAQVQRRLEQTAKAGAWRPRLERITEVCSLGPFERELLASLRARCAGIGDCCTWSFGCGECTRFRVSL